MQHRHRFTKQNEKKEEKFSVIFDVPMNLQQNLISIEFSQLSSHSKSAIEK